MKKLITLFVLSVTVLLCSGQVLVQSGLGLSTSGFIHPISEIDAGWVFKPTHDNLVYQASVGWVGNPYMDKNVYTIKGGVNIKDWTFKAGIGLVNSTHNVTRVVERFPQEAVYVYDTHISAYNTLVLGAERYITKWSKDHYKIYYGVDLVDGYFYAKMGFRFNYKVTTD